MDVPTARDGRKHVIVFTDGASSDASNLQSESTQLQNAVDAVYAFGIGSGPNEGELEMIASNSTRGFGWDLMDDFSKYEFIIRNFILIQGGCDTELVKPFRIDEKSILFFPMPYSLYGIGRGDSMILTFHVPPLARR